MACKNGASAIVWQKSKDFQSILVIHEKKYFTFNIYTHYIEWKHARIIWIAFYKNNQNKKCFIDTLGKDVVKIIFNFLGKIIECPNRVFA